MKPESDGTRIACERLARSRERLRLALQAAKPAPSAGSSNPDWLGHLKLFPGFDVVLAAARAWWSQQPLHQAGVNLAEAANAALRPLAQRAPFSLVAGAAALGGLLVWLRPWRWLPASALLATLVPTLLGKAAAHQPLQAWLMGLAAGSHGPPSSATPGPVPRPNGAHPSHTASANVR